MPTKYKVATTFGTFTRSTERTYSHLVIARGFTVESINARYNRDYPYALEQLAKYEAALAFAQQHPGAKVTEVRGKDNVFRVCDPNDKWDIGFEAADWQKWAEQQREHIASWTTRQSAELAKNQAAEYGNLGWSGRYALAVKVANTARTNGYRDVRIIEVATGKEV